MNAVPTSLIIRDDQAGVTHGTNDTLLGLHATITSELITVRRWCPVQQCEQVRNLLTDDTCLFHSRLELHERAYHDHIIAEIRDQLGRTRANELTVTYLVRRMVPNWLPGLQKRFNSFLYAVVLMVGYLREGLGQVFLNYLAPPPVNWPGFGTGFTAFQRKAINASFFTLRGLIPTSLKWWLLASNSPTSSGRPRAAFTAMLTDPATDAWMRQRFITLTT